jgi:hypothetical protein
MGIYSLGFANFDFAGMDCLFCRQPSQQISLVKGDMPFAFVESC